MTQHAEPLVSLIMVVKNGMPHLESAIASVAAQTYSNVELVIQDGASTDGSLELIQSIQNIPHLALETQSDGGPAQAFNRAVQRCKGEIVGTIFADDLLEPDALKTIVAAFENHPDAAAIYGDCKMLNAEGQVTSIFQPDPFDLLRVLACELVPPFSASFFSKAVCADRFYFDEELLTELGFWLRLSDLLIVKLPAVLSNVRVNANSATCQVETYERACQDKIAAIEQYLAQFEQTPLTQDIYRYAVAGVYAWAAESMLWIPSGTSDNFNFYYEKALAVYPTAVRLKHLKLQQEFTQTQRELFQARDTIGEIQDQLHRSQNQLEVLVQEHQNLEQAFGRAQVEQAHLHEAIAAMESSKFWQLRTQWIQQKQRLKNLLGQKHD